MYTPVVVHVFCVLVFLGTTISAATKLFPSRPARKANVSISLSVLSLTASRNVSLSVVGILKFFNKDFPFLVCFCDGWSEGCQLYLNCEMTA